MKAQPATEERVKDTTDLFPEGFGEYWHFARHLTKVQQDVIFDSLPHEQREKIKLSLHKGGWLDVVMRDKLSNFADLVEKEYGYKLMDIRCKVLKGKSVYLPRHVWDYVCFELQEYLDHHKAFLVGGIKGVSCKQNPDVTLIIKKNSLVKE